MRISLAVAASEHALHTQLRAALLAAAGPGAVSDAPGDPVILLGALDADASPADSGVRLSLAVAQVVIDRRAYPAAGGVLLTVAGNAPSSCVDEWRRRPDREGACPAPAPCAVLWTPAPDDEAALALRGVTLVGIVKSAMLVQVVRRGTAHGEAAAALRLRVRRIVDRGVGAHSARSAAIVRAIMLGDRAGLDDETEERLQEAGTYHVLAISGGNIAVFAAALMAIVRLVGLRPGAAHLTVSVVLVGYAFLVGGGASVTRATLMAVMYLVAHAVDHRAKPFNAIGASAGLALRARPAVGL